MLADGSLENNYDINRDVQPIVEDLKSKWKFKLEKNQSEKDKVTSEMVEREI